MFKAMIILKRREGLGFDEFKSHWLNHHATLVRQLPNIRKAVFNFSTEEGAGEVDAVSELWFDSQQDFLDAYASEIGQEVAQDSLSRVSKRERVMLSEQNIV
ncbi:MAG: EthD family reductase [Gammaproteobacteria bacterium]|nr:EthD family reductase [Gammaproteobacteria bacterium]